MMEMLNIIKIQVQWINLSFVPENMKYDKYNSASIIDISLPYPVFFADKNGDSSPDMFVIKDKMYRYSAAKSGI